NLYLNAPSGYNVRLRNANADVHSVTSGAVGIGTNTPGSGQVLDVNGPSSVGSWSADVHGYLFYDSTSGNFAMEAHNNANTTKKNIIINAWGGSVGIGSSAPTSLFNVYGGTTKLQNGAMASSAEFLDLYPTDYSATAPYLFMKPSSGGVWNIGTWNGSATYGSIDLEAPQVGINTTSVTSGYALTVNGNVIASGYFSSSDIRLKKDIKDFDRDGLAIVNGMRTVHFKWKKDDKAEYGVIAQEVEKVLPEAVKTDGNGYKEVAYDRLVLPVIEAVKKLSSMVTDLQGKVAILMDWKGKTDTRMTDLEKQIKLLEQQNKELADRNKSLDAKLQKVIDKVDAHPKHKAIQISTPAR
ncbi:MAG TPA: tail fiber domain-containing protein, partial [Alphaproteobacteria bacterium]|nr:tail fiber domain-containing protein [Alphaproteobacteria bacterium]